MERKKLYFTSDFHLGFPTEKISIVREKSVVAWLNHAAKDAHTIFLLGDIFDFWFEYKKVVPKGFVRILACIANITEKGVEVCVFPGNHDLWYLDYLVKECGVKICHQATELRHMDKVFYLHHGDGLGGGELFYRLLKKFFLFAPAKYLFRWLHPDIGVILAQFLSKKSRHSQKRHKGDNYLGDNKEFLTQFAQKHHEQQSYNHTKDNKVLVPNFYIFGHRHLVLNIKLHGGATYINLGDWLNTQQYAVFDGNTVELKPWPNENP